MENISHLEHIRNCLREASNSEDCVGVVCGDGLISVCKILLALYIPFLERLEEFWNPNFDPVLVLPEESTEDLITCLDSFLSLPEHLEEEISKPDLPNLNLHRVVYSGTRVGSGIELRSINPNSLVSCIIVTPGDENQILVLEDDLDSNPLGHLENHEGQKEDVEVLFEEEQPDVNSSSPLSPDGKSWEDINEDEYKIIEQSHPRSINKPQFELREKRFLSCEVCSSMVSKYNLEKHLATHSKEFFCSFCSNRFATKVNVVIHERNVHNKPLEMELIKSLKLFSCDKCGKVFISKYHLFSHISSHTNIKHFPCDECGKMYASRSNLIVHKKIHEGNSKKFRCPYEPTCEKRFSHKSEVKQHKFTHSKVKEYKCIHCGNLYSRYPSLWKHLKKCSLNPDLMKMDSLDAGEVGELGEVVEEIQGAPIDDGEGREIVQDIHQQAEGKNHDSSGLQDSAAGFMDHGYLQESIGVEIQEPSGEISQFDQEMLFET